MILIAFFFLFLKDKGTLKSHVTKMGEFHNDKCVTCGHQVASWEEHEAHVAEAHAGRRQYRCGLCGFSVYDNEQDYKTHFRICNISIATGPCKPGSHPHCAPCTVCGMEIKDMRNHFLDYHIDMQHKCPHCEEVFFSMRHLRNHEIRQHVGKRKVVLPFPERKKCHLSYCN